MQVGKEYMLEEAVPVAPHSPKDDGHEEEGTT